MIKKNTIILITLLFSFVILNNQSYSQFKDYTFKLGLQGNYLIPGTEFSKDSKTSLLFRPYGAFRLSKMFSLGAGIGYGWIEEVDYGNNDYKATFIPIDLRLIFTPVQSPVINPYVYVGGGITSWWIDTDPKDPKPQWTNGTNGLGELGFGCEFALNKHWIIDVTGGFNVFSDDKINGVATNLQDKFLHDYDRYFNIGIGIEYAFEGCSADDDKDGLGKCEEEKLGTDPNNPDTDNDGLIDGDEVLKYKTNPLKADTDGDGLSDGDEVMKYKTDPNKADTDGDGLNDGDEVMKYKTDPLKVDTDGDGLTDGDEVLKYKTDPLNPDTDGDGLKDGEEVMQYKTDPLSPDTDKDGLTDYDEVMKYKTDPLNDDTDGGTVNDGIEVNRGTNPLDPKDDITKIIIHPKTKIRFSVKFNEGKYDILPEAVDTLNKVLEILNSYDNLKTIVKVVGYTNSNGSAKANQKLSENRANAVVDWLVDKGISKNRLVPEGKGEKDLIYKNILIKKGKVVKKVEDKDASKRVEIQYYGQL